MKVIYTGSVAATVDAVNEAFFFPRALPPYLNDVLPPSGSPPAPANRAHTPTCPPPPAGASWPTDSQPATNTPSAAAPSPNAPWQKPRPNTIAYQQNAYPQRGANP